VKVQEIHRRAFRLKLLGIPTKEIAARIGRAPDTVSMWFRDREIFQAYVEYRASFDAEEDGRLHRLYGVVVDTIHDLLLHGNENTKYQLCLSILKMRGELPERLIVEHHEPQTEEECSWDDITWYACYPDKRKEIISPLECVSLYSVAYGLQYPFQPPNRTPYPLSKILFHRSLFPSRLCHATLE